MRGWWREPVARAMVLQPSIPRPPVRTIQPSAALKDRVAAFHVVVNPGGTQTVLPSTGAVLGFQSKGRVASGDSLLAPVGVTGLQAAAREFGYRGETQSLLVRFTPQGANCLGVPASELAGHSVALGDVLPGGQVAQVQEEFLAAGDALAQVAVVERFLAGLPLHRDWLVERALAMLAAQGDEELLVAQVARTLGVGERQLERRFLARVGTSPKRFASLQRFERAVALARTSANLGHAAAAAGYFDQSHLTRDFKRFAGMAPGAFFKGQR